MPDAWLRLVPVDVVYFGHYGDDYGEDLSDEPYYDSDGEGEEDEDDNESRGVGLADIDDLKVCTVTSLGLAGILTVIHAHSVLF